MGNRTVTEVLEQRGSFKNNKSRQAARADEPKPTEPVGDVPAGFTEAQTLAWKEIVETCPIELTKSDRLATEQAARALAKSRSGEAKTTDHQILYGFLVKFGMTPSDRSRVKVTGKNSGGASGAKNSFASLDD